jgi:hypothetical protein
VDPAGEAVEVERVPARRLQQRPPAPRRGVGVGVGGGHGGGGGGGEVSAVEGLEADDAVVARRVVAAVEAWAANERTSESPAAGGVGRPRKDDVEKTRRADGVVLRRQYGSWFIACGVVTC